MPVSNKKDGTKPNLHVTKWFRDADHISTHIDTYAYSKPTAWAITGGVGTGKSSCGEVVSIHYPKVIDVYGSHDNEGLAWCRKSSPVHDSVLFLKGDSVKIDCNCADVKSVSEIKSYRDLEPYRVVLSCTCFYSDTSEEWANMDRLMKRLWYRYAYTEPWCFLIREASSLLPSRVTLGERQVDAKNQFIYVFREMRHCGYAVVLDTLRWPAVDIEVRNLADYTIFKAQGISGFPDELDFMYRWFSPQSIRRMDPDVFAIISRFGPVGRGYFDFPIWHKKEKENLLSELDILIDYKEMPHQGDMKTNQVGDYEHVRIIKLRLESPPENQAMEKIAKVISRSSRTVLQHIRSHNAMISAIGRCDRCERVNATCVTQNAD